MSAVDWHNQTHLENYHQLANVQLQLFSGLEILVKHCSSYNKDI